MTLSDAQRAAIARLAAAMVPGGAGMPGAAELDLSAPGGPVDRVLQIEPRHAAGLAAFLDAAGAAATLDQIEAAAQDAPEAFAAFGIVIANAYFMHPDTRAAIGYPGQEARDSAAGLTDEDRALLDAVRARGPVYRTA